MWLLQRWTSGERVEAFAQRLLLKADLLCVWRRFTSKNWLGASSGTPCSCTSTEVARVPVQNAESSAISSEQPDAGTFLPG